MSQELSDKIRAAAQAKGIDPEVALRIARAESSMSPAAQAKTSTAGGLFQVVDKTWKEYGGKPGKKLDADENIRVGTDIIAKNAQTLKAFLQRDPRPAELYAAHYFGPSGAKSFLSADPNTPIVDILGKSAVQANPNLRGKNVGQVLSQLETKMGGKPAQQARAPAPVQEAAPAPAPMRAAGEPGGRIVSAAPVKSVSRETVANLGPGYQAALALSFLADTDEKEDRDVEKEPGIAEQWLAQTASRPAAMAQFADLKIRSPFAEPEQQQPVQMFNKGGEVEPLTPEEIEAASKPAFLTPKSGIGRKISTKPGELEAAALQGVSETPYNLLGAPVDLATMAMRPFGYDVEKPMFGSEDLKQRALKAGIRQKPPEGAAARALYEMGQLGASAVNPAAPVRGAVAAAQKTGEAAKMLEDMTVGNIQRGKVRRAGAQAENIPDTAYDPLRERMEASGNLAYAVRNKGTPVVMYPKRPVTTDDFFIQMGPGEFEAFKKKNPDVALYRDQEVAATPDFQVFAAKANAPMDQAEVLVKKTLAITPDPTLNSWFMKALPRYLRSDFASPQDQMVRAAEEGKLLHLAPKKFSDYSITDAETKKLLEYKKNDIKNERRTQGFLPEGETKEPYGQTIESLTDIAAYPEQIGDLTPNRVPPGMRGLLETNPEARVMDFAPDIGRALRLPELRDKMLEIRALGPKAEYSAYGQAPAKVPDEFLLPDDTLAKLNVAAASNRVARFTRWQDETRQAMATTALRSDPGLNRRPLQEGKYIGVALPDVDVYPDYMKLVNDVGCDGGWCTQAEGLALTYGSGDARLHVIVSGEGKKARPIAQLSVEKGIGKDGSTRYGISEVKERGDTTDFLNNPALPAIQEYVQELDNVYGGLRFVSDLKALGMKQLPKNPMELLTLFDGFSARSQLAKAFGSEQEGFKLVRDELIKLNNGSQYTTGNEDAVAGLIDQAVKNVLNPRQRANGGMIERQSTDDRKYL
jgi:hypothetical protein